MKPTHVQFNQNLVTTPLVSPVISQLPQGAGKGNGLRSSFPAVPGDGFHPSSPGSAPVALHMSVGNGLRSSLPPNVTVPPSLLQRHSTLISQSQPIATAFVSPPVSYAPGTIPNSAAVSTVFNPMTTSWQSSYQTPVQYPQASYPQQVLPPVQTSLPCPSYDSQGSNVSFLHGGPLFPSQAPAPVYSSQLRSYKKRDPPTFKGDILKFPAWYHEWRYVIAPSGMFGEREF